DLLARRAELLHRQQPGSRRHVSSRSGNPADDRGTGRGCAEGSRRVDGGGGVPVLLPKSLVMNSIESGSGVLALPDKDRVRVKSDRPGAELQLLFFSARLAVAIAVPHRP